MNRADPRLHLRWARLRWRVQREAFVKANRRPKGHPARRGALSRYMKARREYAEAMRYAEGWLSAVRALRRICGNGGLHRGKT